MNKDILNQILNITDEKNVLTNEPMMRHTTFRVGGAADYFITPQSSKEAADIVRLLLQYSEPFYILGNGSNLLVSDEGYRGVILNISKGLGDVVVSGTKIRAGAGALLSQVASVAINAGLKGLVFASGIPGSIGGAIVMNAGAYGGEMKDVVESVTMLDIASGEMVTRSGEEMAFGYRTSLVKSHPYLVLEVTMNLEKGDTDELKEEARELAIKRKEKQPLEYPSAGSTFKRPEGYFAGKLIEDCGLKGCRIGGAEVSKKHSGFVINTGNATALDIISLINHIRAEVYKRFRVVLEPEVIMLGNGLNIEEIV